MRRDKQGILPTVGALLVCAALLGGPALWARLGDARRTQLVTARPVTAGALDEDARAIPVLYELRRQYLHRPGRPCRAARAGPRRTVRRSR